MPQHHALLIGINEYAHLNKLGGCLNDVKKMHAYLQEHVPAQEPLHVHSLLNQQATRTAIVEAFEQYLIEPAKVGDRVYFHFSGHGAQEVAHKVFRPYEPGGLLEGIVCHDSGREAGSLLCDKELRYLFYLLGKKDCHVLAIFDCCHSGDNMRNRLEKQYDEEGTELVARRVSGSFPARKWEDFLFTRDPRFASEQVFERQHLDELMPQARHIHFAACQDFELAYEHPRKHYGYFTDTLLECLRESKGKISYFELQRQIQHRMRIKKRPQTPHIYVPKAYYSELFRHHRELSVFEPALRGRIGYYPLKGCWMLNLGGIHGVLPPEKETPRPVVLHRPGGKTHTVFVREVFTDHSLLDLPEAVAASLHTSEQYEAWIQGLMGAPVRICLSGEAEGLAPIRDFAQQHAKLLQQLNIGLVPERAQAHYCLHYRGGQYLITLARDERPLMRPIPAAAEAAAEKVFSKFRHISQWNFIKNLQPSQPQAKPPIQFVLHPQGQPPLVYDPAEPYIQLCHAKAEEPSPAYKFQFINRSEHRLYVACLYLDHLFEVEVNYFEPNVRLVDPGDEVWGVNGRAIRLRMPDYIREYNWKDEILYLKIISSPTPFKVDMFALPPLDAPEAGPLRSGTKGFEPEARQPAALHWQSQLIEFRVRNPYWKEA